MSYYTCYEGSTDTKARSVYFAGWIQQQFFSDEWNIGERNSATFEKLTSIYLLYNHFWRALVRLSGLKCVDLFLYISSSLQINRDWKKNPTVQDTAIVHLIKAGTGGSSNSRPLNEPLQACRIWQLEGVRTQDAELLWSIHILLANEVGWPPTIYSLYFVLDTESRST